MYQSETLSAVRDAAQTLTREGKVLAMGNAEFPLAIFANTYQVDAEPTNTELPQTEVVAVEDHFDDVNQDSTPAVDDTREAIVNNLFTAITKVQFNTTNVIIPAIKAMHSHFANLQQAVRQPEYSVKPWRYLAPHDSVVLVNHINTRYSNVKPKQSYQSFVLAPITADEIIEIMTVNNPHLEQETVTEWALQVGSDKLLAVWNSLFQTPEVVPSELSYLSADNAPFNVDELLAAYFLCGSYTDNPVQVPGQSVDLEDWEHQLKLLHEMFGFYLMRAYVRRLEYREAGELILKNEAINPINTRRAVVIVNGDVFDPWIVSGGDFQAVLGAAIENTGITELKHIVANSDALIARWHEIYPLIKQSAIDFAERQCVNDIIRTFREIAMTDILKERHIPDLEVRLKDALRYLRRDDYCNPYKVFSTLVCKVYFPESTYIDYLDAIDAYGQDFPKATVRELATQAMISLMAIFLGKQIKVEEFEAEIIEAEADEFSNGNLLASAVVDSEEEAEVVEVETAEEPEVELEESETPEDESDFTDDPEEEDPYAELESDASESESDVEEEDKVEEDENDFGDEPEVDELKDDAIEAKDSDEEAEQDEAESEDDDTPLA